jgi:hypothetical protein
MTAAVVHRVLVLSDEPIVAALVGILIEVAGRTPVFADPDESPADALERLRPFSAVLTDIAIGAAHSDLFFASAAKSGIAIAVFGPEMRARELAEIASARNVPWFTIPPTASELARALDVAGGRAVRDRAAPEPPSHERGPERRESVAASVASDGTRILVERSGQRWMVYDRRSPIDRRRDEGDGGAAGDGVAAVRMFVSDTGETRRCGLDEVEVRQASAAALELQLARSTRV